VLDRQRSSGLSNDPTRLTCYHTTMTTAVNLAVLRGASRIAILGLDGKGTWHHAPHPQNWGYNKGKFQFHADALIALVDPLKTLGIEIYNLNPESNHKMFPFGTMDDILT